MRFMTTAVVTAGVLAAAASGAAIAAADPADSGTVHQIGTQGTLGSDPVIEGWTISDLKPSSDVIPYQSQGTLWEATATDEAIQGTMVPIVANLSARSASGQTYQALFTVPAAQGVSPTALAQGQKTTGKVYFDVTGDTPNSVVYQSGGQDMLTWVAPSSAAPGGARTPAPAHLPTRSAPSGGQGTPAAGGSQGTSAPGGSQGTPAAGGSQGTPITEGS